MPDSGFPPYYDDLDLTLGEALRLLGNGVHNRKSPFHTPSIATISTDGRPQSRIVVMRAFDPDTRSLRFHTDKRSEKVSELRGNPAIAVLLYDAERKVQIRLVGEARLHTDDSVADRAWQESRDFSRICYRVEPGPGHEIGTGGEFAHLEAPESGLVDDPGRGQFVAVEIVCNQIEWLYLSHQGHRRARFDWSEGGRLRSSWLVP